MLTLCLYHMQFQCQPLYTDQETIYILPSRLSLPEVMGSSTQFVQVAKIIFFLRLNHALNPKLTSLLLSIRIKIEWVITPIYIGSCRVDGQSGLTFDSPPPTNSDRTVITVNFRKQQKISIASYAHLIYQSSRLF